MVLFPLYVIMLLGTGFFQSMNSIEGLRCYQCNDDGITDLDDCKSVDCSQDEFHKQVYARFDKVKGKLIDGPHKDVLSLEEYCYLRYFQPIPVVGYERGCYIALTYNNTAMMKENKTVSVYEKWTFCKTDNCNDHELPVAVQLANTHLLPNNSSLISAMSYSVVLIALVCVVANESLLYRIKLG
ncbi:hypothetical protein Ocin01_03017 [Orchesella cincta]|uniref:Protein quiver n=1 Tax=Orchesella cincta TaxID=48709 RepID=A0A1D2NF92_ORCCI|nr:hypothetical protein Ocin01_03017 [Orchesella cincta]